MKSVFSAHSVKCSKSSFGPYLANIEPKSRVFISMHAHRYVAVNVCGNQLKHSNDSAQKRPKSHRLNNAIKIFNIKQSVKLELEFKLHKAES